MCHHHVRASETFFQASFPTEGRKNYEAEKRSRKEMKLQKMGTTTQMIITMFTK